MVRAALTAIAGVLLLVTQIQCAAACASELCADAAKSESMPPCHRHNNHANDQGPASCLHQTVSAPAILQQTLHADFLSLTALAAAVRPSSFAARADAAVEASYAGKFWPPGAAGIASVILRI